jgi:hypothetical protein
MFLKKGRHWEVVCGGGRAFRVRNTLGARYLDYLLHEPNEPIRVFDLQVEVQPENGEARVRDSFQPESDPQAMREYRPELRRLQMETAQAAGEPEKVARLEGEMEALKSALSMSAETTPARTANYLAKACVIKSPRMRKTTMRLTEANARNNRITDAQPQPLTGSAALRGSPPVGVIAN